MTEENGSAKADEKEPLWASNPGKLARRMTLIAEIARTALSKLEVGDLLDSVTQAIHKHFGFYDVSIFLVDPEAHDCVLVAQCGDFRADNVKGYRQGLGEGIVGGVAQSGQTTLVNDTRAEPLHVVAFPDERNSLSELAVPVRLHDHTVGVINIENREVNAFDACDVMALETLAEQIAQAIANAQLFERTRLLRDLNRSIIDAMPSGLCVLDEDMKVLYANPTFGSMFCLNETAALGRHMCDVFPTAMLESGVEAAVHHALTETGSRVFAGVTVSCSGLEKILNVRVTPAQMPEGLGVLLMFEDVTEWRRAMALAEERLQLLDLVVSHVPVAVISWDMESRFTFWGSGAERLFGQSDEATLHKRTPYDVFETHERLNSLLHHCREQGSAEGSLMVRHADGRRIPALTVLGRLEDNAGQHVGYTAVVIDETERHKGEETLLREKQKLESVVGVIGAGLALVNQERKIIWANTTMGTWFGHGQPLEDQGCHLFCCRNKEAGAQCPTERCFATHANAGTEIALIRGDGAARQYHIAVTPVLRGHSETDTVLMLMLDITDETKKVYQLSRLRQLGELMQGVLELDRLLNFVLTCVTAGQGLGFNRAILLLVDRHRHVLEGRMGVGPASGEEAGRIWSQISRDSVTLEDLLVRYDSSKQHELSAMDRLARNLKVSMSDPEHILVQCALNKQPIVVDDAYHDPRVRDDLRTRVGARQFVVAPLIARNQAVGVVMADNLFTGEPISQENVELLCMFANQAAMAIENAENYQQLEEEKAHLEKAYQDLADAQDKLLKNERLVTIGRMAAHIAHEIRNPLVNIGGFAKAMSQRPDIADDQVERYSGIIASEVRRLETILKRVMDFTKPAKPLLRRCSLRQIILEMLDQFRDRAGEQKVEIATRFPEQEVILKLDADQMKQVFLNLIQNALDVMKDGGHLEVETAQDEACARAYVRNTGRPIHPEDLPNIFTPFFSTRPGGTGLGLAVTQKIVQDHGGDIGVTSNRKRGTEFVISLPLSAKPGKNLGYRPV